MECTLSACADVQAHSCTHCQDSVGTCVYVCEDKMHGDPCLPHWADGRADSEGRHTLVWWSVATAHLVMPV